MKLILSICFVLAAACCSAQTKQAFYFKNNGMPVDQADSADYVRIVSPPDSASTLFNISEYYLPSKQIKLVGKSATLNPPTFDGQCISYGTNGKRQAVLNYADGALLGSSYLFYPNGKLYLQFDADTSSKRSFEENTRIITCMDSTGKAVVTEGNGHYVAYDDKSHTISEEGDIKDGKHVGEWHGNYASEKVTFVDTYQDGKFISGVSTTANGTKYTYTTKNQSPEFTGGINVFVDMVKKKVKLPATLKGKTAQIFVSFNVAKDGKVVNPMLLGSLSPEADKAIIAAISSSPAWKPRIQNGLPVASSWGTPIVFGTAAPAAAKAPAKSK
ncbi:energy transducer TonB [Mucilaginibacter lacusdianchii]|uniref:energy transducer TonB n=1 Tax=Mucilaginibacter lacusdianchii TaxID=2684211 RepID=UPI00131CB566|nr:energy transducer TonB [Mucilaginibacter sp. JXJ CY 39]